MILACDPGITGAWGAQDALTTFTVDMPTREDPDLGRRVLDRPKIIDLLRSAFMNDFTTLVIEKVGGIPGQAAHSAFTFGHGAGGITYAAEAIGFTVHEVPPMRWKSAMKCPADKAKAIARATEVFPAMAWRWEARRGNGSEAQRSGRAEAALMAEYGRQVYG